MGEWRRHPCRRECRAHEQEPCADQRALAESSHERADDSHLHRGGHHSDIGEEIADLVRAPAVMALRE